MSDENSVTEPKKKSRKHGRSRFFNIVLLIAIIVVAGLFVRAEKQRRSIEENLEKTSQELEELKKSTENSGQEAANKVLQKVRALIDIPGEPAPTVATITDVETLRKSNDFYNKANNGDTLIITANRAILYNAEKNIIIDVVPVEINADAKASASPSPKVSPSPVSTTSPSL
ncbi:MAG: hypothetical protein O3A36_03150 [bacterium]|nr:hypothetical protein [bacterium]